MLVLYFLFYPQTAAASSGFANNAKRRSLCFWLRRSFALFSLSLAALVVVRAALAAAGAANVVAAVVDAAGYYADHGCRNEQTDDYRREVHGVFSLFRGDRFHGAEAGAGFGILVLAEQEVDKSGQQQYGHYGEQIEGDLTGEESADLVDN